ncbi:retroviral-like aspartic protease family protein [Candidatus Woesearchaeota archaeon]|nr:retroviral-like aspartic protease family protein [Candidatus Woesearchaeota archaeon]
MGHVLARVKISGPLGQEQVELLVDTGATYTWISKDILERLGIKSKGTKAFRLMNHMIIEKEFGEALVEWNGETATTIVIFAEQADANVFGVYSLEGLALEVDPVVRELRKSKVQLAL